MRAATLIVGAIAASSVLIALAFILSGGGSSDAVKTRTVTEAAKTSAEEPSPQEAGGTPAAGGLTECNGGEFTVENVSCAIGEDIHRQYEEGGRGEFIAIDEEAGETITMSCEVSTPVICTGPGGASVYFAP